MTNRPFFQVTQGTPADVGLCDGLDGEGSLCTDIQVQFFKSVLKREGVDDGGQHACVVRGGAFHAVLLCHMAAPDVASSDNDPYLDTHLGGGIDFSGSVLHSRSVNAEAFVALQGLAAELEQDSLEHTCRHGGPFPYAVSASVP